MRVLITFVTTVLITATAAIAQAPAPVAAAPPTVNYIDQANAEVTKQQLGRVLNQYPPTVARVLQTDPALLTDKEYLTPYPALAAFVAKHPEIIHNAGYFLGSVRGGPIAGPV